MVKRYKATRSDGGRYGHAKTAPPSIEAIRLRQPILLIIPKASVSYLT